MPHEPRQALTSSARTTSGTVTLGVRRDFGGSLSVFLDVTVSAGTSPTLDVEVRWSHDGVRWASAETPDSFAQITAPKSVVKTFPVRAPLAQLVYTIAGSTPSFTFEARSYTT